MLIAHKLSITSILTSLTGAETLFIKASETTNEYVFLDPIIIIPKAIRLYSNIQWCTCSINFDRYKLYFQELIQTYCILITKYFS